MIPDWFLILNYKIIDTSSDVMIDYNYLYLPFNGVEAIIWFGYSDKYLCKLKNSGQKMNYVVQSI